MPHELYTHVYFVECHCILSTDGAHTHTHTHTGFLLEKKVGVNQPKKLENARILIANTAMDTDKIKVFGSKVRVDSTAKVAELELAEKVSVYLKCDKVEMYVLKQFTINCFINRSVTGSTAIWCSG